ncbi:MAG TPA: ATP-dependent DNA helicase RecG [Longimicrobiaceae bacterium]|nr:ATP-dependent DNA helicase RecG [Longimicrobiaceae bacterium]
MEYSPLDRPAQFLKGVGPKRAQTLARLGLLTARDVLYHVPRRYEDASTVKPIVTLEPGVDATVIGRVFSAGVLPTRKGLRIFQAVVRDESGSIECSWPGQPYLERLIRKGDRLLLSGPVRFFHGRQLQPREYTLLSREGEEEEEQRGEVFPVYPATEGLSQRQIRKLIGENLDDLIEAVAEEECFSPDLLRQVELPTLAAALRALHRPDAIAQAERGRQRLAFEELFFLQLLHARARYEATQRHPGIAFRRRDTLVRPFYGTLPFALTGAQKRVLREIGEDMASPRRMNRLLQGDVGAGKTVVALFAMLRALENGYQAALMAPTEILAEQHLRTVQRLLGERPLEVRLLTGRMGAAERREALERIASGQAGIVVGTHALIQESVRFARLGMVVVDEQHRFGVRQRLALTRMGDNPDVLVMSATPIPRSLALTLYGDLDVSILDERPPGRQPVRTVLRNERARGRVFEFIREQVRAGRQAYLVYPLVEESEKLELKSATEEYERLRAEVFPELRLGLIHGQMPGEAKEEVMHAFAEGEVDVLVATTVIEVGIDVQNASVMVIEHAERFGLSQLHQLRGRVGRGAAESYCILLAAGAEAAERLRIFTSTEDGFRIAEADMRLRGQGDLFGDRQSGVPAFRFADLERDTALLARAREEARRVVDEDPELAGHPRYAEELEARYAERLQLFRTG